MTLKRGDKSPAVKLWQQFLVTQGFTLTLDSDFGPAVERATRSFQAANDLRADGIAGDNTFAAAKEKGFEGFPKEQQPEPAQPSDKNEAKLIKLHPTLAAKVREVIAVAAGEGFELRVVQGLRTFAEQDALYEQGRTRKGPKVTNARGGQSNHNYGVAADLAFVVDGQISWNDKLYKNIGRWAKAVGLDWGGNWKFVDLPHVELADCPNWRELSKVYQSKGLPGVWALFG